MDDLDLNNFELCKFLDSNSDSESDSEECVPKKKPRINILAEKNKEVCTIQIKNQLTTVATSKVCKLMNGMPNTTLKIPVDHRTRNMLAEKNIDYNVFVICEKCDELNPDHSVCQCGQPILKNSKKNNFLIHFPLEVQLRRMLEKHFDAVVQYFNREHKFGEISDFDDGELYKEIRAKNPNVHILPITMNLDGAQVFKSSRGSLWPLQLYLNFLPPEIRFLPKNIILSTIYFGSKKPNMTNLLYIWKSMI